MGDYTPETPSGRLPQSGDVYALGTAASVQFGYRPILFRVIRVQTQPCDTYIGWVWLDGYELNQAGDAVERRSVFVQLAGLHPVVRSRPAGMRVATSAAGGARNQRQVQGSRWGNGSTLGPRESSKLR